MEKQLEMRDVPRPHYLVSGDWEKERGSSLFRFEGEAYFPSEGDETLSDRDHINVTHLMHATWNAAHLASQQSLIYSKIRVRSHSGVYVKEPCMDSVIFCSMSVEIVKKTRDYMKGIGSALFRDEEGLLLATLQIDFVAWDL